ncbi:rhodopsin, G0-coupled-like [Ptychodera flava]|uniref:rhodopsin, G0-coupled-like n=1 Tax=Ptychodera flava TaxID=63121 RepID=UPI00396AA049
MQASTLLSVNQSTATDTVEDLVLGETKENKIVSGYLLLVCTFSVLGNGFVILHYAIARPKVIKPIEKYIVNLAFSDIGVSVLGYPIVALSNLFSTRHKSTFVCFWDGFSGFVFGIVNIWTVTAIACSTYLALRKPGFGKRFQTGLVLVLIWILALLWSALPMFGFGSFRVEINDLFCSLDWSGRHPLNVTYNAVSVVMCYVVPLTLTVTAHTLTYRYLAKARAVIYLDVDLASGRVQAKKESTDIGTPNAQPRPCVRSARRATLKSHERAIRKASMAVSAALFIAWTPYAVLAIYTSLARVVNFSFIGVTLPALFAKTTCAVNPITYLIFDRQFRLRAATKTCAYILTWRKPQSSNAKTSTRSVVNGVMYQCSESVLKYQPSATADK